MIEEKEQFNKAIDDQIYESMQISMAQSRAEKAEFMAAKQQYEDDGWNSSRISPNQPEPEPEPEIIPEEVIEESIPEIIIEEPKIDGKDTEIQKLKDQLAALNALKELDKEEDAEILENHGE